MSSVTRGKDRTYKACSILREWQNPDEVDISGLVREDAGGAIALFNLIVGDPSKHVQLFVYRSR